jgi:hypothetical protein
VHHAEIVLRLGVALRCGELKQPPRLGKVLRPTIAVVVHPAELGLRLGVALRCSEPKQPPRLGKVAQVAHEVARKSSRISSGSSCSKYFVSDRIR